jgi:hypothetical protein
MVLIYFVTITQYLFSRFHVVYQGSELGCKVSRLKEDCEYQFRAKATGKGGEGPPGEIHAYRTLPVPKPIPRGNI